MNVGQLLHREMIRSGIPAKRVTQIFDEVKIQFTISHDEQCMLEIEVPKEMEEGVIDALYDMIDAPETEKTVAEGTAAYHKSLPTN